MCRVFRVCVAVAAVVAVVAVAAAGGGGVGLEWGACFRCSGLAAV